MNKKDRTIKAIEILIKDRYTDGKFIKCPLCVIHYSIKSHYRKACKGCPNYVFKHEGTGHCSNSKTFLKYYHQKEVNQRLKFWQQALPKLKKLPPEAFVKKGYKGEYFKFLIELDNKIAES